MLKIYKHSKEDLIIKERHIDFLNIPLIVNENRKRVQTDNHLIKNIENRIKFIKINFVMCKRKRARDKRRNRLISIAVSS